MEITAINGYFGIRPRTSLQSAEKITARVFENRDSDGDNQLSVQELGNHSGLLSKVDSNGDNFVNQEELFAGLTKRLEEKSDFSIEISLNINVIKANLGNLLTSVLNRSDSDSLTDLLTTNGVSTDNSQVNTNANERYINALITAGIEDDGLFGGTGGLTTSSELRDAISPTSTTQNDGRQLLLDLLTRELGTPQEDALAILSALQSQSFQTVA